MHELFTAHLPELLFATGAMLLMLAAALRVSWRMAGGFAILLLAAMAGFSLWAARRAAVSEKMAPAFEHRNGAQPMTQLPAMGRGGANYTTFTQPPEPASAMPAVVGPRLAGESWALALCALIYLAAAATALLALGYLPLKGHRAGEFFALLAFAALGLAILARAADFITLFLGLETASLALYALTATLRHRAKSLEAALKYFILGAAAAAMLLLGIALLYGSTAAFSFAGVFPPAGAEALGLSSSSGAPLLGAPLLAAGLLLVTLALAFKAALVPFHMWAPDAYSGAATPVSAFMMIATKTAVFAVLLRLGLAIADSQGLAPHWGALFTGLGLLTLFAASTIALLQRRIKRLLGYTAIASSGFAALAIAALVAAGADRAAIIRALAFYLGAYALSTLGLAAALTQVEAPGNLDEELKEFTGLGSTRPKFAAALAILLFSAMGLPGTVGFLGKFFVLRPLIGGGAVTAAVLAILITVIASAYYLKLIMLIYMRQRDPDESYRAWRKGPADLVIFVCAALSLILGLWPALGGLIPLP